MTGRGSRESSASGAAAVALASMAGIAAATASFAWARWSNWSIQRTDVEVASQRLPQAFDRMRIVHVSDLHNAEFGPNNARLLHAIRRAAPRRTPSLSPATWLILAKRARRSRYALSPRRRASHPCITYQATMSRVWTSIRR